MTIQRQYRYKDPLEVLEMEERRTCKGCVFKGRMLGKDFCEHPSRTGKATKRCKHYTTGEDD